MVRKLFCFTVCFIFVFAAYYGHTEKMWGKYDIDESPYAEVHGHADWYAQSHKTDVHIHCLGYAHSNRKGNYTLLAMVAEVEGENWGREDYPPDDYKQGRFEGGCYVLL